MKTNEIREFFSLTNRIQVDLEGINCQDLSQKDINAVSSMLEACRGKIPFESKAVLAHNLLSDLVNYHCCAIAGITNSPCYLGKMAETSQVQNVDRSFYLAHHLGNKKVRRRAGNLSVSML